MTYKGNNVLNKKLQLWIPKQNSIEIKTVSVKILLYLASFICPLTNLTLSLTYSSIIVHILLLISSFLLLSSIGTKGKEINSFSPLNNFNPKIRAFIHSESFFNLSTHSSHEKSFPNCISFCPIIYTLVSLA